jgi:hypothetical protein
MVTSSEVSQVQPVSPVLLVLKALLVRPVLKALLVHKAPQVNPV